MLVMVCGKRMTDEVSAPPSPMVVLIRLGYAGFGVEAARQRQSGELVAYRLDSGETYSAACLEGEGDLAHAVVEGTVPSVVLGVVSEVYRRMVRIGSGSGGIEEVDEGAGFQPSGSHFPC